MARQQGQVGRQEGSRWINRRPEPDEFAKWFHENVKMHDGLSQADYLPGITLIPNKEKIRDVVIGDDGQPRIVDVEQLVYAPYPKVETRVGYFWDLMFLHPDWTGKIKLVEAEPKPNLPRGFFHMPVEVDAGRFTHFIGVSYQVEITDRRGRPVIDPPAGTKVVPLLKKSYSGALYADENAIHKAQTGGMGRALGFAGMLIVPGAGIATAEDMLEFMAAEPTLPTTIGPALDAPPSNGQPGQPAGSLEDLVGELRARLESEFPSAYEEAIAWAAEKGYDLNDPPKEALRGLERLLRKKVETAEKAPASA